MCDSVKHKIVGHRSAQQIIYGCMICGDVYVCVCVCVCACEASNVPIEVTIHTGACKGPPDGVPEQLNYPALCGFLIERNFPHGHEVVLERYLRAVTAPKVKVFPHTAQYDKNGSTKARSAFFCALPTAAPLRLMGSLTCSAFAGDRVPVVR
jgi:hypothetical protein